MSYVSRVDTANRSKLGQRGLVASLTGAVGLPVCAVRLLACSRSRF